MSAETTRQTSDAEGAIKARQFAIPYKFHQSWKSKNELNERFKSWRASFFHCNAGIENRFYDDDDNRHLVYGLTPAFGALFDSFPKEIFRVDFVRSLYMFFEGGLYADLDFQCLCSFDPIFSENKIFLGGMGTDASFAQYIPNAMMASPAGEGFWLGYLKNIESAWETLRHKPNILHNPEHVTGPIVLKKTVIEYSEKETFKSNVLKFVDRKQLDLKIPIAFSQLEVLPGHVWYPLNWNDQIHQMFRRQVLQSTGSISIEQARAWFPNSMAVTYWAHSWGPT